MDSQDSLVLDIVPLTFQGTSSLTEKKDLKLDLLRWITIGYNVRANSGDLSRSYKQ